MRREGVPGAARGHAGPRERANAACRGLGRLVDPRGTAARGLHQKAQRHRQQHRPHHVPRHPGIFELLAQRAGVAAPREVVVEGDVEDDGDQERQGGGRQGRPHPPPVAAAPGLPGRHRGEGRCAQEAQEEHRVLDDLADVAHHGDVDAVVAARQARHDGAREDVAGPGDQARGDRGRAQDEPAEDESAAPAALCHVSSQGPRPARRHGPDAPPHTCASRHPSRYEGFRRRVREGTVRGSPGTAAKHLTDPLRPGHPRR